MTVPSASALTNPVMLSTAPSGVPVPVDPARRLISRERLSAQLEQLAPLPAVALTVMKIADDPDAELADLAGAVSYDPIMAGRVLRTANTPFFSRRSTASTVEDACRRLGFKTVRNIVVASCMVGESSAQTPATEALWRHSLLVAIGASRSGRALGLAALSDKLFLAGFMHDLGGLIVAPLLPETVEVANLEAERVSLGADHTEIGADIAQQWNLPEYVVDVIRHHHHPEASEDEQVLSCAVHLIDVLEHARAHDEPADARLIESVSPFAVKTLSLDAAGVISLYEEFDAWQSSIEDLHAALS